MNRLVSTIRSDVLGVCVLVMGADHRLTFSIVHHTGVCRISFIGTGLSMVSSGCSEASV